MTLTATKAIKYPEIVQESIRSLLKRKVDIETTVPYGRRRIKSLEGIVLFIWLFVQMSKKGFFKKFEKLSRVLALK